MRIDQLNALRFKMQSGNKNCPREKIAKISGNGMPGIGKEIPKEETYNKYGDTAREIETAATGKRGVFSRIPSSEIPGGCP